MKETLKIFLIVFISFVMIGCENSKESENEKDENDPIDTVDKKDRPSYYQATGYSSLKDTFTASYVIPEEASTGIEKMKLISYFKNNKLANCQMVVTLTDEYASIGEEFIENLKKNDFQKAYKDYKQSGNEITLDLTEAGYEIYRNMTKEFFVFTISQEGLIFE